MKQHKTHTYTYSKCSIHSYAIEQYKWTFDSSPWPPRRLHVRDRRRKRHTTTESKKVVVVLRRVGFCLCVCVCVCVSRVSLVRALVQEECRVLLAAILCRRLVVHSLAYAHGRESSTYLRYLSTIYTYINTTTKSAAEDRWRCSRMRSALFLAAPKLFKNVNRSTNIALFAFILKWMR